MNTRLIATLLFVAVLNSLPGAPALAEASKCESLFDAVLHLENETMMNSAFQISIKVIDTTFRSLQDDAKTNDNSGPEVKILIVSMTNEIRRLRSQLAKMPASEKIKAVIEGDLLRFEQKIERLRLAKIEGFRPHIWNFEEIIFPNRDLSSDEFEKLVSDSGFGIR